MERLWLWAVLCLGAQVKGRALHGINVWILCSPDFPNKKPTFKSCMQLPAAKWEMVLSSNIIQLRFCILVYFFPNVFSQVNDLANEVPFQREPICFPWVIYVFYWPRHFDFKSVMLVNVKMPFRLFFLFLISALLHIKFPKTAAQFQAVLASN